MGVRHCSYCGVKLHFHSFEVDLDVRELLRTVGLRLKLSDQAFELLASLLERAGEVAGFDRLSRLRGA